VTASELVFAQLSGRNPPGDLRKLSGDVTARAEAAFAGLVSLLTRYADPDQPYIAIGGPSREDRPFDFDHLSRWREWNHLDAGGTGS
jgi:hypothetical protein